MFLHNARKWKLKAKLLSLVWLLATPWTAAYQAPLPMGFSRQEYWSGVPLPQQLEMFRLEELILRRLELSYDTVDKRTEWVDSLGAACGSQKASHAPLDEDFVFGIEVSFTVDTSCEENVVLKTARVTREPRPQLFQPSGPLWGSQLFIHFFPPWLGAGNNERPQPFDFFLLYLFSNL